jgi:hypothetical protein
LAKRGFRVFPLVVDGRKPAVDKWPERASDDPAIVARYWSDALGEPEHYNIGIATGRGLVVLDFDCKNGKAGLATLEAWDMIGTLPVGSLRARTASGGVHVYLSAPEDVDLRNTVEKLEPGVDVRAYHGYVIAPGSTIGGLTYEWLTPADSPIEPMADDMIERCLRCQGRAPAVDRDDRPALVDLDAPAAIRRAIEWLRDEAPEATQGNHGDETTFWVACMVRDFGVSEGTAVPLIAEHWNETEKVSPSWPADELERKIANAYRYAQNPFGVASPAADFDNVLPFVNPNCLGTREGATDGQTSRRFQSVPFADVAWEALADPVTPLIKGWLDQGAMSVMYGESNSGKTFVALDMAYHIAAGVAWNRRHVNRGRVVYVVAEGGRSFAKRCEALKRAKGGTDIDLHILRYPINLFNSKTDLDELILEIETLGEVSLLVIDTLSRALSGGDENSSTDMGALIKNLDRIRARVGAHIMIIHHSGKDRAKGARGWSGLRAATDTEIEIADNTVHANKQRDMDALPPVRFRLDAVDLGADTEGDPIRSCVVALLSPGTVTVEALNDGQRRTLAAARLAAEKTGGPFGDRPIHMDVLFDAVATVWTNATGKSCTVQTRQFEGESKSEFLEKRPFQERVLEKTIRNHGKVLEKAGFIQIIDSDQWVVVGLENLENKENA